MASLPLYHFLSSAPPLSALCFSLVGVLVQHHARLALQIRFDGNSSHAFCVDNLIACIRSE